jgi:uncharacterized membrane protein
MMAQDTLLHRTDTAQASAIGARLAAIDALRGIVMTLMLVDHMRETIYLHMQVSDPVDVDTVEPALFFTRLTATLCAPVFIALAGLSAWLYGQTHSVAQTRQFLLKRGVFLILLEVTVINFAWTGTFPPDTIYLQVIWCIGLCMIALALLMGLPRGLQVALAAFLIAGHHLLDPVTFAPGDALYEVWAILHDRSWMELGADVSARTSYPILPWIGIILLGYLLGPLFRAQAPRSAQIKIMLCSGIASLFVFIALRSINVYGDFPWAQQDSALGSVMAFLSLTKYPPSLLFSAFTLGIGALVFAWLLSRPSSHIARFFSPFGAAPMFFYIVHLYVLKAAYLLLVAAYGTNKGDYFGVDHVWIIWAASFAVFVALYLPTVWFAKLKQRRRDIRWLRYL